MKEQNTFSADVKARLAEAKIAKKCCREAFAYGRTLFDAPFVMIDRAKLACESCAAHFFRGLFVSYGSVNSPDKPNHLEMKAPDRASADEIAALLGEYGLSPKVSKRRSAYPVYFKDGDEIVTFLGFIGADKHMFDFLEGLAERQVRGNINRQSNFETANMRKTARAAKKQLDAISFYFSSGKADALPQKIAETARLKLENPEATLAELAALHDPPVTKSCVDHRLAKIIGFYEKNQ